MSYFVRDGEGWNLVEGDPPEMTILDPLEQELAARSVELDAGIAELTGDTLANTIDNRFVIRIFKRFLLNPRETFSNVYELKTSSITNISAVLGALWDILAYEKAFHLTAVDFYKATASTWKPDGAVYNPWSFTVVDLDENGNRSLGSADMEPAEATFFVAKNVAAGHGGKLWYRGCLLESDKNAPAGEAIETGGGITSAWSTAYVNHMAQYMGNGSAATKLALVGDDGTVVRTVRDLAPTSIRYRQTGNIYFDRA